MSLSLNGVKMNLIIGNYGDPTIALIQYAHETQLHGITVIDIDTGWGAAKWQNRVEEGKKLALSYGFNTKTLRAKPGFDALVQQRKAFPNQKFQWCAGILKGLTLLNWLDEQDPMCEALVIMGKRRLSMRSSYNIPEFVEQSEHHGDRKLWYPLYKTQNDEYLNLLKRSGIEPIWHRSLECQPCINSSQVDLTNLDERELANVVKLEDEIKQYMFEKPITTVIQCLKNQPISKENKFDMGCGTPFGCGE